MTSTPGPVTLQQAVTPMGSNVQQQYQVLQGPAPQFKNTSMPFSNPAPSQYPPPGQYPHQPVPYGAPTAAASYVGHVYSASMSHTLTPQQSGAQPSQSQALPPQQQNGGQMLLAQQAFSPPPGPTNKPPKSGTGFSKLAGKAKKAGMVAGGMAVEAGGLVVGVDILGTAAGVSNAYNTYKISQRLKTQNGQMPQIGAPTQASVQASPSMTVQHAQQNASAFVAHKPNSPPPSQTSPHLIGGQHNMSPGQHLQPQHAGFASTQPGQHDGLVSMIHQPNMQPNSQAKPTQPGVQNPMSPPQFHQQQQTMQPHMSPQQSPHQQQGMQPQMVSPQPAYQQPTNGPVANSPLQMGPQHVVLQNAPQGPSQQQYQSVASPQQHPFQPSANAAANVTQVPLVPQPLQIPRRKPVASNFSNMQPNGLPMTPISPPLVNNPTTIGQQNGMSGILRYPEEILQAALKLCRLLEKHHESQEQSQHQTPPLQVPNSSLLLRDLLKKLLQDCQSASSSTVPSQAASHPPNPSPYSSGLPQNNQVYPAINPPQQQVSTTSTIVDVDQDLTSSFTSMALDTPTQSQGLPTYEEVVSTSVTSSPQVSTDVSTQSSSTVVVEESMTKTDAGPVDLSSLGGFGGGSFNDNTTYFSQNTATVTNEQPIVNTQPVNDVGPGSAAYGGVTDSMATSTQTSVVYTESMSGPNSSVAYTPYVQDQLVVSQSEVVFVDTGAGATSVVTEDDSFASVAEYSSVGDMQQQSTYASFQSVDIGSVTSDACITTTDVTDVTQFTSDSYVDNSSLGIGGFQGVSVDTWDSSSSHYC
ncbi:MAG: hypothetical protein M1821_005234 [Bathelium mastoideum]|nr:MAG: hypothetical protein M1821_005234 [Bathelium mastoideum]